MPLIYRLYIVVSRVIFPLPRRKPTYVHVLLDRLYMENTHTHRRGSGSSITTEQSCASAIHYTTLSYSFVANVLLKTLTSMSIVDGEKRHGRVAVEVRDSGVGVLHATPP